MLYGRCFVDLETCSAKSLEAMTTNGCSAGRVSRNRKSGDPCALNMFSRIISIPPCQLAPLRLDKVLTWMNLRVTNALVLCPDMSKMSDEEVTLQRTGYVGKFTIPPSIEEDVQSTDDHWKDNQQNVLKVGHCM